VAAFELSQKDRKRLLVWEIAEILQQGSPRRGSRPCQRKAARCVTLNDTCTVVNWPTAPVSTASRNGAFTPLQQFASALDSGSAPVPQLGVERLLANGGRQHIGLLRRPICRQRLSLLQHLLHCRTLQVGRVAVFAKGRRDQLR
jgi:hypothetical protein